MSCGVTFVQCPPSSRETWISPSSVPTHSSPREERRFRDGEDGVVVLDARDVLRDRSAGGGLLGLVVAGQVPAHGGPALAPVARLEQPLRTPVERLGIVRRHHERRGPVEAMLEVGSRAPRGIERPYRDVLRLEGVMIEPVDRVLRVRIDDLGIARIGEHETAFAAAGGVPVAFVDRTLVVGALDPDIRVVLLRTVNPVGKAVVHRHVVELRRRLIVRLRPGLAAVVRDDGAAVAAVDEPIGVARIDPQPMMIAVPRRHEVERLAPVDRFEHSGVEPVDHVAILGVGVDLARNTRRAGAGGRRR